MVAGSLVSSVTAANSGGCGKDLPTAQSPPGGASHETDFTTSDGTARTYLIHIPSSYDKTLRCLSSSHFTAMERALASRKA